MKQEFIITENDAYQTILKFMRKTYATMPLTLIYKLFRMKKITINDVVITDMKVRLAPQDVVLVYGNLNQKSKADTILSSKITLKIVYEDENILIADKPHNVLIHHPNGDCLDNAVRNYLPTEESHSFTISHVHRLDKLTRGLVVYAKKKLALNILHQFWNEEGYITKKYLGMVSTIKKLPNKVTGYINYHEFDKKMEFTKQDIDYGKLAITKFKLLKTLKTNSWYEIELLTGRKHQIRATCEYLKSPIVGDFKYGSTYKLENKIMLLAYKLEFNNLPAPLDYLNNKCFVLDDIDKILK